MRKILALLLTLTSLSAYPAMIPFSPELEAQFDSSKVGLNNKKIAKAVYDVAALGGTASATYGLGVTIPSGATIVRSFLKVNTAFTATGNGIVGFKCQSTNDIFVGAAGLSAYTAPSMIEGVHTGASALFENITADCQISAVVGLSAITAGKMSVYLEYVQ